MSSSRFPSLSSLAVVLSASVVLAACAPSDEGAAPAIDDTLPVASAPAIRAHVEFLADDLLEGRLSGTRGYDIAAGYVASEFAQIGLRPGATDGGWLQPVALVESLSLRLNARVITEVANDDARPAWHPGNFFGETFAEPAASPPAPTP